MPIHAHVSQAMTNELATAKHTLKQLSLKNQALTQTLTVLSEQVLHLIKDADVSKAPFSSASLNNQHHTEPLKPEPLHPAPYKQSLFR